MPEAAETSEPGLRERKKERTRRQIAETARELFAARGFDRVPVAEIARAADVSEQTVFNYFPTKEDLFYSGLELFQERLLDAIRNRDPGEPILAAFARFVTESRGVLASEDADASERLRTLNRVIAESPTLLAREQRIYAGYADALAELIAEETDAGPDDVAPLVAAHAMIGLHKALVGYVRRRVLSGETDLARIASDVRAQAEEAVALLERGLGRVGIGGGTASRSA